MAVPAVPTILSVVEDPVVRSAVINVVVPATATTLTLWRVGPSGTRAGVRGYDPKTIGPGPVVARDYEIPIGVPVAYYATAGNASGQSAVTGYRVTNLHPNPSAETSLNNVQATGSTGFALARSNEVTAKSGSWVFKLTQGSAVGGLDVRHLSVRFPVVAGQPYSAAAEVRPASTVRTAVVYLDWFNAAGVRINNVSGTAPEAAGAWTRTKIENKIAPVGAVTAQIIAGVLSAAAGEVHYVDAIIAAQGKTVPNYFDGSSAGAAWVGTAGESASQITDPQLTFTLASAGCADTWLNDLARVQNTMHVELEQLAQLDYPVPATVHEIIGRRAPIVASDIAHVAEFEVSFLTASLDEREQARALLSNGLPVLLRTPPEYGLGNVYFSVLGYSEQRILTLGMDPNRRWAITARTVDRPDTALFAPIGIAIYDYVNTTFASYSALKAGRATYDAVLYDWSGSTPADVVPWPPDDV